MTNIKALYFKTCYMLQKHYRTRILTARLKALIEAAETAINDDCFMHQSRLALVVQSAKKAVRDHGYSPENNHTVRLSNARATKECQAYSAGKK